MNKNFPLISIVILNYNGLKYLKKTIPAILSLNYQFIEVIVVDNGSKDGSLEFINSYENVKVINNNINNYSIGKNIGALNSTGEFLLLLDNDILIEDKELLKKLVLNYTSETAFLYVPIVDEGEHITTYYGLYYGLFGAQYKNKPVNIDKILNSNKIIPIGSPDGKFMFIKRSIWSLIGGFDDCQEFNIDDVDIGPRAYLLGYKNYLFADTKLTHLGVNNQQSSIIYASRFKTLFSGHARSMLKIYKYHNLIWRLPLLTIFMLIKSIRYSVHKRSIHIFFSYFYSIKNFLILLPNTLKQRQNIQSKRIILDDDFLHIKSPNFTIDHGN
ncbi:MAG: glycosyltransferase [bacterium]